MAIRTTLFIRAAYVRYTETGDGTAMATTVTAQYPVSGTVGRAASGRGARREDDDTLAITYVTGEETNTTC